MNGKTQPESFFSNKIKNTKYNILTLIPIVLFNQFKYFYNMFFLLIALSQFIPTLKVGFLFTYVAPLGMVLLVIILKEASDDIARWKRDKDLNNKQYEKLNKNGSYLKVASASLKVSDIIKVNHNERCPADLLLLFTTEKSHTVFIRTDQLDGETDWKLRKSISMTQNYTPIEQLMNMEAQIVATPPTDQIYDFKGYFQRHHLSLYYGEKEALSLENTLWANTVLASQGYILAMVLYTGVETRAMMNEKEPRMKFGRLEDELNKISKFLFGFMVVISLTIVALNAFSGKWYIQFFRFILLLSSIIPISLRVNLDIAKIYYCSQIGNDNDIKGTIARNSTIPEELGRIQYMLTDKTGTLTQNDMTFKKVGLDIGNYDLENIEDLKQMVIENCQKQRYPMTDIIKTSERSNLNKKLKKRDMQCIARDFITALALCHNVTPSYPDPNDLTKREYQASSPDEIALVSFADKMGMKLLDRDANKIVIQNSAGQLEEYQVKANFPFSSATKRMGIVLKHDHSDKLILYLKGAEVVMKLKVKAAQRATIDEVCDNLSIEGLRTLVIAQKVIDQRYFNDWQKKYKAAQSNLKNRDELVEEVINELEQDMELLAVTGVEDKLQEDVAQTIEFLRGAGIKVWMLTGDKVETATCIAVSAGFKSRKQQIFYIKDLHSIKDAEFRLKEFEVKSQRTLLMIDGQSLDVIMRSKYLEEQFFNITILTPSVCVCRCSPTQKAIITKKIGIYSKKRTLAVGDGGNDVGMIQEANIGVGIEGKEGKQASLVSDFSITEFQNLKKLVIWHGRESYYRSSLLAQFVVHRGLIISIIQAIFSIIFYFVAIPIYNGYLMLGYSTIYTTLPVFSLLLDEDIPLSAAMKFPPLYESLQNGRFLSIKTYLIWLFISIYQGCFIMLASVVFFRDSYANIVLITFSSLIIIELLNVYSKVNVIKAMMVLSSLSTLVVYGITIVLLKSYFDVSYIQPEFILKILTLTVASWLPIHIVNWTISRLFPTEQQKILKQEQILAKRNK